MMAKHSPGPWRTEAVSDAVRVVVGSGRAKVILARCAPPQIPEGETHANARLMAAAPDLLEVARGVLEFGNVFAHAIGEESLWERAKAAVAKAEGQ